MIQPPDLPIETGKEMPLQLHDILWLGAQLEYLRWLGSTDDVSQQHVSDVLGSIEKKLKVRSGSSILVQQISKYQDYINVPNNAMRLLNTAVRASKGSNYLLVHAV